MKSLPFSNLILLLILILGGFLRFYNLGYSDYIPDETTVMTYFKDKSFNSSLSENLEYFMSRRKGPMQTLVAAVPYLITQDAKNEFAHRLPFALFSTGSILVVYLLVLNMSNSKIAAFTSALLLSVDGFFVIFGRIVQYQSLNIFFSLISLYFYSFLLKERVEQKNLIKYSILGTVFFAFSLLSHWDAVLYLPLILYFFISFIFSRDVEKPLKLKILLFNILVLFLALGPFLIVYLLNLSQDNLSYMNKRVGINWVWDFQSFRFMFEVYNPFVTAFVYVFLGISGVFLNRHGKFILLWFVILYGVFEFLVRSHGTHLYNILLPVILLGGFGMGFLTKIAPTYFKAFPILATLVVSAFLFHQSYLLFVDTTSEYPWNQKTIHKYTTKEYNSENMQNNIIGFAHRRNWKEISRIVNDTNKTPIPIQRYITNEDTSVSNFYMDLEYSHENPRLYIVGIKDPLSFMTDYKFSQYKNKIKILDSDNDYGLKGVRIMVIDNEFTDIY